jgi:2-(1,2-epoxy-1,2-dihydrophenyl)acetyl-CoA isomerase
VKISLDVTDGIADLRLNRPDQGNAIDLGLCEELRAAAFELRARRDLRVVRLTGEGERFCVGGDLGWMAAQEDRGAAVGLLAATLHDAIGALLALEAPVVAGVRGVAAGAGFSFVLGADLALAAPGTQFTAAYTGVGLSPDGGQSWLLPRLVGHRRATELILTNRRLDAAEALELGLLTAVAEDLDAELDALVARLAAGPTVAFGAAKRLLRASWSAGLGEQLDAEARSIGTLAGSPTGREGVDAFLERRRPSFAL